MDEIRLNTIENLDQLEEILLDGFRVPFSGSRLVNEQETIEILNELRSEIPSELTQASRLVQNQAEFIQSVKKQAEEIINKANCQREQLVSSFSIR